MIFRNLFRPLFDVDPGAGGGGGTQTPTLPEWASKVFSEETLKTEWVPNKETGKLESTNALVKDLVGANYKTPDDFAKSYLHAQATIGKKRVEVPTEKSTPEEREAFWTAIGRPTKAEEYKLTVPEKLHPSIKITPEGQKKFYEQAYKFGFTNQQAQELNAWYLSEMSNSMVQAEKSQTEAAQKSDVELRNEWGSNYDTYSAQAEKAFKAFAKDRISPDSLKDPNVKRVFQLIGSKISEDTFKSMTTQAGGTGEGTAEQKIKDILNDPKHPYNVADHPDHKKAVNDMLELNRQVK